jgi:hypothetical protein
MLAMQGVAEIEFEPARLQLNLDHNAPPSKR